MSKKFSSIIAITSLLFQLATPAFAATTLEISGNGADTENAVQVSRTSETNVVQSNNAEIKNDVQSKSDTGSNEANKNTGGGVSIKTGDADSLVSVENSANSNSVDLENCDCEGDVEVLISENGADSKNAVDLATSDSTLVAQDNKADIDNKIRTEAETGDNEANKNTSGDVEIETGDATVTVGVKTEANANSASIGGGSGSGSMLSARILGNGADSENKLALALDRALDVVQSNDADVENDVKAEADTGDNEAEENTGGMVGIETGDADVLVGIDNMVNFNVADVDCDCFLEDVMAKIAGNGADSESLIAAELGDSLGVFQANCGEDNVPAGSLGDFRQRRDRDNCGIENKVDTEAESGDNEVEESTGDYTGDPSVETGDAIGTVLLENSGNVNTLGSEGPGFEFGGTGFEFDFHLDLSDLLALLGL